MSPTLDDIHAAAQRIKPYIHRTPVLTNKSLNQRTDAQVYLKCENLQKVGAFKFRGACNAVFSLGDDEAAHGVCTHSSGNHAQALALAAKLRGIPAYIVMPQNAPKVKKEAVAAYGGQITFCEPTLEARESALAKIAEETGCPYINIHDLFTDQQGRLDAKYTTDGLHLNPGGEGYGKWVAFLRKQGYL